MGDQLVVRKLGRSVSHLVHVVGQLRGRGVWFISLTEGFDVSFRSRLAFSRMLPYGGEHHTITARIKSDGEANCQMTAKDLRDMAAMPDQLLVPANGASSNAVMSVAHRPAETSDRPGRWLAVSMTALAILAVAAAVVSYSAQYRMVYAAKGVALVAALEAGIPDVAALVFATLGIALALHGKRAIRARVLNLGAVGTSVGMNVLASGAGWRDLAIWAMPPVAYALASDTAIGVVRAWTIARHKAMNAALADDDATPLAIIGGFLLWALRLVMAPASTLVGFRRWVIDECPVAPGRTARQERIQPRAISAGPPSTGHGGDPRPGSKTSRFLALVTDRYGPLAQFPVTDVSRVSAELAPEVDLDPGAARTALRRHVLAAQPQENT